MTNRSTLAATDRTSGAGLGDAQISSTAALLAEPARGAMLWALSDGRALTAGELARRATIGAPTASAHLARLVDGGLLVVEKQGRHRYYRLREPKPLVRALEALAVIAPPVHAASAKEAFAAGGVRNARFCYDHLAGRLGVQIADALVERHVLVYVDSAFNLSGDPDGILAQLGVDRAALETTVRRTRRPLVRACLDWSERRHHVAGALGAALAERLNAGGWIERTTASRAVRITNLGRRELHRVLGIRLD